MRAVKLLLLFCFLLPTSLALAQTGKIEGVVKDSQTGESLPGVNVAIQGTTIGATTDVDGYYSIIAVPPGSHTLRASFVGYTSSVIQHVNVSIDLTTTVDITLQEQTVGLDELVVVAQAPIIQRDIAGTQRNISVEEIQAGRYQSITNVIAAQTGVQATSAFNDRPNVRGGGFDETQFFVDGINQSNPLTADPAFRVNLDAIQEIKLQTGGFSADVGNLRSGAIMVVTKEGGERYSGSVNFQYSAPGLRHDGAMMYGKGSPLWDPFVDPLQGAWTGYLMNEDGSFKLDAAGNKIKTKQFRGWDTEAADAGKAKVHQGKPMELYAKWLWQHRSKDSIEELKRLEQQGIVKFADGVNPDDMVFIDYGDMPDYRASFTFGGPVPFFNRVRFFTSYDTEQTEYSAGAVQPAYRNWNWRGKLTTNLAKGVKLNVHGLWDRKFGGSGGQGPDIGGWITSNPFRIGDDPNKIWYPWCQVPAKETNQIYGAKVISTLSANTFWELDLMHQRVDFEMVQTMRNTAPTKLTASVPLFSSQQPTSGEGYPFIVQEGNLGTEAQADAKEAAGEPGWENWRDWAKIRIGDYWYDEAPRGYDPVNWRDVTGDYRMSSCNVRLSDTYSRTWEGKGAVTSQVNRTNQVKAGFELRRTYVYQYYDALDPSVNGGSRWKSEGDPWTMALFAQDKLEYKGFVANIGLRLDGMIHGSYPVLNGDLDAPDSPYSEYLLAGNTDSLFQKVPQERIKQFRLSPRLGISHPISSVAKIFFNYGHMYQWLDALEAYRVRYDVRNGNRIDRFGNPQARPPRTIMYEVGYEHNLFNRLNLRMTGYYKDTNDNLDNHFYELLGAQTYEVRGNRRFEDVRGFETFLELRRGSVPYFSGWVSANWAIESGGNFGYERFFQDPTRQARPVGLQVDNPDIRPIIKVNADFFLPEDFGPKAGPFSLLGGLNLNLLYTWERGQHFIYNPNGLKGLDENIRWKPYQRWDMRLTKNIASSGNIDALFFIDVTNLFNNRNMTIYQDEFEDGPAQRGWAWDSHTWWKNQWNDYMNSLDLEVQGDGKIKGSDRPGDYPKDRLNSVYVPINRVNNITGIDASKIKVGEFYLDRASGSYKIYESGVWRDVTSQEKGTIDQAVKEKSYINMPDFSPWTFLEMRDIFFGIKLYF